MDKRKLDISIISDVHLGAYECRAKEILNYLQSIHPEVLVLNGDFIDITKIRKNQLSQEHQRVIHEVVKMASSGTKVYFISQNYQDEVKKYPILSSGFIHYREKLELILNKKSYLIFHGSNIQSLSKGSRFSIRPGTKVYDVLLKAKTFYQRWERNIWKTPKYGLSKSQVKKSPQAVLDFENSVSQIGKEKGYDYVICGFIHQPEIKEFSINNQTLHYMNSGDWVENLTALEYRFKKWELYEYDELDYDFRNPKLTVKPKKTKLNNNVRHSV